MNSQVNKHQQQQALREKQRQMEIPVELIKIQDTYNRSNIEQQHKFNLEIHKKQSRLTIFLTLLSVFFSLCSTIIGIMVGIYIERSWPHNSMESQLQKSLSLPQQDNATIAAPVHHKKENEITAQLECSSTNFSLNTLHNKSLP